MASSPARWLEMCGVALGVTELERSPGVYEEAAVGDAVPSELILATLGAALEGVIVNDQLSRVPLRPPAS